ncbi:hypothetical protein A3B18_01665 [Candidatus Giovannonibacteria bacterium RIFCSPLOWO2_01_FULL_46_13]|uniref:SIMPL domain-containing protein n=1 Tax=Candidatus Giovannonibacteria bacterium RIFCSPLOWO2_01_FULL_46_13 TaxID=1798352 RepID=A0A1F5X5B9_9BACT|nr:MAG: hypothetical protein A3B18_01665 [Candidatus Giovannonibacteria bacterium RIFCSPLOWO2_01_FULL_46_13]
MDYLSNGRIKGVVAAVGVLLALFLAIKSIEAWRGLTVPRVDRPAISVTGEGKIFIKPDIGQVNFAVVTEAATVADAQKKATDAINEVFASLKGNGIEEKDIKTTNYSISPKYDYQTDLMYPPRPVGSPNISGYTVSQNLDVKIRDLSKSGEILTKAAQAGANQVGGIMFTTEDLSAIQAEARNKAIEDASKKAKELEDRLGINLGKIINFYESGGPYPIYRDYTVGKGGDSTMPAPAIPIGENEVVVNVTVTYQIR